MIEWLLLLRIKTEHEPALFRVNNGLRGYILHILRFWIRERREQIAKTLLILTKC